MSMLSNRYFKHFRFQISNISALKILQIIQKPQRRGAEIFTCQLSEKLLALGHQVVIIALFEGEDQLPFSGEIIKLNRPYAKRWRDFTGWRHIAEVIADKEPDIVQANAGDTLKYAVLSRRIFGWKQPVVSRNASMVSLYIKNPVIEAVNRWLYSHTERIISVSNNSMQDLNTLFPATKEKSTVIPVGVDTDELKWSKLSWPQDQRHIVHVGGFTFEKNHQGLLRIFSALNRKFHNLHLHLVGDGPLKPAIEKEVTEMGLTNITFYGYRSNPLDFIASADVLVLPSIIEGLPGVILEAFYCQTPVVAYNVGGIGEVIEDKITGRLISPGDENSFISSMEDILNDPDQTGIWKNNGRNIVTGKYNNRKITGDFVAAYFDIFNKSKKQ